MFPRLTTAVSRRTTLSSSFSRPKTTSSHPTSSRHLDPTFEKLIHNYKSLIPVLSIHNLILSSPNLSLPLLSSSLPLLPPNFIQSLPAIFSLRRHPSPPSIHLTPAVSLLSHQLSDQPPLAIQRITRLLSLSHSHTLPLRSLIRISHDLGFPPDFLHSTLLNPSNNNFSISTNPSEPNTHLISLACLAPVFIPAVESCRRNMSPDRRFEFKQIFPPGMRLTKGYRQRLRAWQNLPYTGPYDLPAGGGGRKIVLEKRAVAIAHEFLSLTVEKMVEVEKFSHFRKWLGIEFNVWDLFLDHPGMFYISAKGRRHTVFLREAYDRGCLVESNPLYEARRKLLHLVMMGKRGAAFADSG